MNMSISTLDTDSEEIHRNNPTIANSALLNKVLHKMNAKVFYLESSLDDLSPKAEVAEQLQQQVRLFCVSILELM